MMRFTEVYQLNAGFFLAKGVGERVGLMYIYDLFPPFTKEG
jgi:hypothetical protein